MLQVLAIAACVVVAMVINSMIGRLVLGFLDLLVCGVTPGHPGQPLGWWGWVLESIVMMFWPIWASLMLFWALTR